MDKEEFYRECARLLDAEHAYTDNPLPTERYSRKTQSFYRPVTNSGRYRGREPGNGRYANVGLVRCFGETVLIVLRDPPTTRSFETKEAALEFLTGLRNR